MALLATLEDPSIFDPIQEGGGDSGGSAAVIEMDERHEKHATYKFEQKKQHEQTTHPASHESSNPRLSLSPPRFRPLQLTPQSVPRKRRSRTPSKSPRSPLLEKRRRRPLALTPVDTRSKVETEKRENKLVSYYRTVKRIEKQDSSMGECGIKKLLEAKRTRTQTHVSESSSKSSPKSSKASPKSSKASPKSSKVSPKSSKISPKSSKISSKISPKSPKNVFRGLRVMVLRGGGIDLGKSRAKHLEELVKKHGGQVKPEIEKGDCETLLVVSKTMKLDWLPPAAKYARRIVTPQWISGCLLGTMKPEDTGFDKLNSTNLDKPEEISSFETDPRQCQEPNRSEKTACISSSSGNKLSTLFFSKPMECPDNCFTIEEFKEAVETDTWVDKRKGMLACQKNLGEYGGHSNVNLNEHITSKLRELMAIYDALKVPPLYNAGGGRKTKGNEYYWKVFSMKKVIGILEQHRKPLRSRADLDEIKAGFRSGKGKRKGIGEKTWSKIWEIMQFGQLQRILSLKSDFRVKAILDFTKIWGVGASTASRLWKDGFRSIADIRRRIHQANLNASQKVGLKHYEDLQQRIPRTEVEEIEATVRRCAESVLPGITLVTCGSYRRGAPSSGDVDILMSHETKRDELLGDFLPKLVERLRDCGFLTDELSHSFHQHKRKHENKTCFGVCRLPAGKDGRPRLFRRIDLKVYPREHFAFAILYFTGSDHFNRSMRWFAHKKGLTLSDHGLSKAIRINREKVWEGKSVFCNTEKEIFYCLGLDYVEPTKRNVQQGSTKPQERYASARAQIQSNGSPATP